MGLIGFVLHDEPLIDRTVAAYKEQIDHNLLPDGSSYDFHERDALHYHIYDITPLLTLAIAARNSGRPVCLSIAEGRVAGKRGRLPGSLLGRRKGARGIREFQGGV